MQFIRPWAKPIGYIISVCMLVLSCYAPTARAGIISTEALLNAEENRATVEAFLAREDVQKALVANGVDPVQALQRTDSMTNEEVQTLAGRIDETPAGGDVVGAAVFVFLVLLLTDILGFTDIFPFVKKTVQ